MIHINLFGGPGVGKSTLAAEIFADLKKRHLNCELVTEYAKDLTWQESYNVLKNQIYVWAKQHQRFFRLRDKVDIVVTDSPPVLSILYDKDNNELFHQLIVSEFQKNNNFNFVLQRDLSLSFEEAGRYQTFEEAVKIDAKIINVLSKHDIKYHMVNIYEAKESIVKAVLDQINIKYEVQSSSIEKRKELPKPDTLGSLLSKWTKGIGKLFSR
jgi:GTPase SAR1 family protein